MNTRRIAIGIGIAITVAVVVVLLLQHGITIRIPWITKKPRIIILRPEGYKIQTIQPGITYKIEALHGIVYAYSNINVLKRGFEVLLNVTKQAVINGRIAPAFFIAIGYLVIEIYKPGKYVLTYKPINHIYLISMLVNNTYNCTLEYREGKIQFLECNLPHGLINNEAPIFVPRDKHPQLCTRVNEGNVTEVICGAFNVHKLVAEIKSVDNMTYTRFIPDLAGELTFKFLTLK